MEWGREKLAVGGGGVASRYTKVLTKREEWEGEEGEGHFRDTL